jgi:Ca2+-binding RTX toxin-like protein
MSVLWCFPGELPRTHLRGYEGDDVVYGGDGSDSLFGGKGEDVYYGGEGDDWLEAAIGMDTQRDELYCGPGKDHYHTGKLDYVDSSCEKKFKPNIVALGGGA